MNAALAEVDQLRQDYVDVNTDREQGVVLIEKLISERDAALADLERTRFVAKELMIERDTALARIVHLNEVLDERFDAMEAVCLRLSQATEAKNTSLAEVERLKEELAWLEPQAERWRQAGEAMELLLRECRSHILAAGHLSPRCEYHGKCRCDRDDLLQRIEAALGEEKTNV